MLQLSKHTNMFHINICEIYHVSIAAISCCIDRQRYISLLRYLMAVSVSYQSQFYRNCFVYYPGPRHCLLSTLISTDPTKRDTGMLKMNVDR